MAYSSVRVQFEIGHEASVRTKKTPEGFTHDWEVFVRGADNTDIQYFVDKVVFHLHETFPKPRRVIKEPPYLVKESGYAGFVLPIDVYLKNKEEPKKISFQYDLQLQPSGPPISRVLREPRLFQNPSEDFRRKLIRGGGVGVDTPADIHADDLKVASINKLKVTDPISKKHKPDVLPNDSFAELFGTPIRRVLDPKKGADIPKKVAESDKKKLSKHGAYKDEKESLKEREKLVDKEKSKEREKNKEKSVKRAQSPPPATAHVLKARDEHKRHDERRKDEYDEKRRKKEEKEKKDGNSKEMARQLEREQKKEKKDLLKELDHLKKGNSAKAYELKGNYEKHNSECVEKEKHKHRHKKREKEKNREKEKHKKEKMKGDRESKERAREKEKNGRRKHEDSREGDDKVKRKSPSLSPVQDKLKKKPLNALLDELGSSDSASPLSEDDQIPSFKVLAKPSTKSVPDIKSQTVLSVNPKLHSTNLNVPADMRNEKEVDKVPKIGEITLTKSKKEKMSSKKSKNIEKDGEKRKVKEESRPRSPYSEDGNEEFEKSRIRDERERTEKERLDNEEKPKSSRERENRKRKGEKTEDKHQKVKKTANQEYGGTPSRSAGSGDLSDGPDDGRRSDRFTKEYVAQLRDLQQRIMSLEDNAELQKVVKVIAETGQYEITKRTFDFDLCALDYETVKRLQDFFLPT